MDELVAAIEAHTCSKGICRKNTHCQEFALAPGDVATIPAEIATLVAVRDELWAQGYQLLEGEPTPRFDDAEIAAGTAKPWVVRFEKRWGRPTDAPGPGDQPAPVAAGPGPRRGWLSRLWTPPR